MSDPIEEAVRRLRGLKDRIDRLEGQREGEGEINILRLIQDRTNTDDTVVAKLNDIGIFDRSTTADSINARENDRNVTDRTSTSDATSTTIHTGATFESDVDKADGNGLIITGTYTIPSGSTEKHVHVVIETGAALTVDGTLNTNELNNYGTFTVNGTVTVESGSVPYNQLVG